MNKAGARISVSERNIRDLKDQPKGWNQRKERLFQDWLRDGKPGLVASGGIEGLDPEKIRAMERQFFADMVERVEMEDTINNIVRGSSKGEAVDELYLPDEMRLFIVTFDEQRRSQALLFSRPFPPSAAANPEAFFTDGSSPERDLERDLRKLSAKLRAYVVSGDVTRIERPGTGLDEVRIGKTLRLRGLANAKTVEQELLKKTREYICEAMESEAQPIAQNVPGKVAVYVLPPEKEEKDGPSSAGSGKGKVN
jgi:hypothetical protein